MFPSRNGAGQKRKFALHPTRKSRRTKMTEEKKPKLLILSQPQRASLEGLSNRRPQLPNDPIRDELVTLGLVVKQGAKWALTPTGKKVLAAGSNRRNAGGFSV